MLAESTREQHEALLELDRLLKYRRATGRFPARVESPRQFRLLAFARAVVDIARLGGASVEKSLKDRLRAELQESWRPLGFEIEVAKDLMARGWDVEFSELDGSSSFDSTARQGALVVPVECKTIRYDSGKAVSRRGFEIFCAALRDDLLSGGSRSIHLALNGRLDPSEGAGTDLARRARPLVRGNGGLLPGGAGSVDIGPWEPLNPGDQAHLRSAISRRYGDERHQICVLGSDGEQVVVVASSVHRDRPVGAIYDRLRKEVEKQLPRPGPCFAFVYIEEIDDAEWLELLKGSALEKMTVHFLRNPNRAHIHSVVYRSHGSVRIEGGKAEASGQSLVFMNENSGLLHCRELDLRLALERLPLPPAV